MADREEGLGATIIEYLAAHPTDETFDVEDFTLSNKDYDIEEVLALLKNQLSLTPVPGSQMVFDCIDVHARLGHWDEQATETTESGDHAFVTTSLSLPESTFLGVKCPSCRKKIWRPAGPELDCSLCGTSFEPPQPERFVRWDSDEAQWIKGRR